MNRNYIFALLPCLALLLQGCAMKQYQTVNETKEVGREKYLTDYGSQKIKSLSGAQISADGKLTLNGFTFTQMTEYEAPKMDQITKQYRPPDPVGALMNTAFTAGLNILLAPKRTGSQLVGDTIDERVTNSYVDKTRGVATGGMVWQKSQSNFSTQITVDGILERTLNFDYSGTAIDLSKYFQESSYENLIQVKVACTSCSDITQIQATDYGHYAPTKVVEFDLGTYKQNIRSQKLLAEKEDQKRISDQKSAAMAGQQKCVRMGLSVGTEDFNLCVSSQK